MIEIGPVSCETYEDLALYLSSFPDEKRSPGEWKDRFLLWWEKNPAFSPEVERGWVLTAEGKIAGFIGNIPTFFQWHGKTVLACNATTWRVSPPYRKHSLPLFFKLLNASQHTVLFVTTPSPAVAEMLKVLKFAPVPREEDRYSVLVVNRANVIRSVLAQASVPAWALSAISPLFRFFPAGGERSFVRADSFQVQRLTQADSSFDKLWELKRNAFAHTAVRTADVINWYCFAEKHYEKFLFGCFREGELKAYLILAEDFGGRCRALRCLDLWGDLERAGVLQTMLKEVWEFARAGSFDLVYFPHYSISLGRAFGSLSFVSRRYRERSQYFKIDPERCESLEAKNSYLSDLHGDVGL